MVLSRGGVTRRRPPTAVAKNRRRPDSIPKGYPGLQRVPHYTQNSSRHEWSCHVPWPASHGLWARVSRVPFFSCGGGVVVVVVRGVDVVVPWLESWLLVPRRAYLASLVREDGPPSLHPRTSREDS